MDRRWQKWLMWRSSKLAECTRLEMWIFMVKRQSSVTPRFLTVRHGKWYTAYRVWEGLDLDFIPKDTITALVLSSLSLRSYTSTWTGGDLGFDERCQFLEMGVISTWLVKDRVFFSDSGKRSCVKNKECRSKDWSLWNTEWDGSEVWQWTCTNRLSVVCKLL